MGGMGEIAGDLGQIFKSFLARKEGPDEWRTAKVLPIFKKGSRDTTGGECKH